MESLVVDCSDRDRIYAISIPVKIALVAVRGAVATRKDENRSLPIATILDAVQHRALDKIARSLHGLAVIGRAPRTAIYGRVHVVVIERGGLIDVRDGAGEDTDAGDFGVVCDTDTTDVIFDSADLASTAGAVVVIGELWVGECFVVVEIIRAGFPLSEYVFSGTCAEADGAQTHKVVREVLALVVEPVVHKCRDDAVTRDAHVPQPGDVHHVLGELLVDQMPLFGEQGIMDTEVFDDGLCERMLR